MSLFSRVDISGCRRSVARRMRRGALPSSLIGLLTFSFTVLAFSSVAYTTSLPALVQAAQRADDDSLFYKALAGLTQAQGEGSAPNDAAQDDGNAALGDAGQAASSDAPGAKPPLGGVSLGGSMLQGVISNIAGVTQSKPDEPGSNGGSEQGGANPDGPAGGGSGGNGSDTGSGGNGGGSDTGSGGNGSGGGSDTGSGGNGSGGGSGSGGTGSENKPDLPTPEEEQTAYDCLLDSYVSRVNAATSAFNNDCLGSAQIRGTRYGECEALWTDLYFEFDDVVNHTPIHNESQYRPAHGNLIAMYRLLRDYVGVLCDAWEVNVALPDPASGVDAFMAPIRKYEKDGENIFLAEFRQRYESFVL